MDTDSVKLPTAFNIASWLSVAVIDSVNDVDTDILIVWKLDALIASVTLTE